VSSTQEKPHTTPRKMANEESKSSSSSSSTKTVLSPQSTALEICGGFFRAMDLDRNGFIEESEVKIIATVAFDETEEQAQNRWNRMLSDMDTNHDDKISHDEYVAWWMEHTKDKTFSKKTKKKNGEDVDCDGDGDETEETYFAEGYASYLLRSLLRITSVKTAHSLCDAFFEAMDANEDGYLVEEEVKNIGKWAFAAKEKDAHSTWLSMRNEMDTNLDGKISKDEYSTFWMAQSKSKIQPEDGTFVPGYRKYLLSKLGKLRAGKRRQEQLKIWDVTMTDDKTKHMMDDNGRAGVEDSPKKSTRISFANDTKDGDGGE
jgi:Ca2+-binding EF-hand superfamily protein